MKHFLLVAGVIFAQIAVDKRCVDSRGRNAIAADVVSDVVLGDGVGHGDDRAFGHGIGEAIGDGSGGGHGSHIENDTSAEALHVADGGVRTVVNAFYVDGEEAIEVDFGGGLDGANVGDAGVVDENVEGLLAGELIENGLHLSVIGDVAEVLVGSAAFGGDFTSHGIGGVRVLVEDADGGPFTGEAKSDGAADSAAGAGDYGDFAVEAKGAVVLGGCAQRETPRFQGMKSFCARSSALVWASPLAT